MTPDSTSQHPLAGNVMRCSAPVRIELTEALSAIGLTVRLVAANAAIPGSFWGDCEAGLRGAELFTRADTPLHSALHEAGHYACMSAARRGGLDTDAGGNDAEEVAVCYWQILATDWLSCIDRARMCADMDRWGYSFRLGSAGAWLADDAEDARAWLAAAGLLDTGSDGLRAACRQ